MSMQIALSGIKAISQQLGAISHNIANTATDGFKSSRTNFASLVAGSQPNGVYVAPSTQTLGNSGKPLQTGRGLDAFISGKGFFVVKDPDGAQLYTRVGSFKRDAHGVLCDLHGRRVQGWTPTGNFDELTVGSGMLPAKASTRAKFVANFSTSWSAPVASIPFDINNNASFNHQETSTVYDSLGRSHLLTQYFRQEPPTAGAANSTSVSVYYGIGGGVLDDGAGGAQRTALTFDATGRLVSAPANSLTHGALAPAAPLAFQIDYTGSTRSGSASSAVVSANSSDGHGPGQLSDLALEANGDVMALYDNGQRDKVGTVALAAFANADGLVAVDKTSWRVSAASGNALYGRPGNGAVAALQTNHLESSNADVTQELVELMSAQRNYQANSKVISAENQMMQSLLQAL